MNERIGQLAQEAGKYAAVMSAHAKFYDSIASTSADTRSTNEMFIEKFAELIVKECAKALCPQLRDMIKIGRAHV